MSRRLTAPLSLGAAARCPAGLARPASLTPRYSAVHPDAPCARQARPPPASLGRTSSRQRLRRPIRANQGRRPSSSLSRRRRQWLVCPAVGGNQVRRVGHHPGGSPDLAAGSRWRVARLSSPERDQFRFQSHYRHVSSRPNGRERTPLERAQSRSDSCSPWCTCPRGSRKRPRGLEHTLVSGLQIAKDGEHASVVSV
jgi:hypothetical protein